MTAYSPGLLVLGQAFVRLVDLATRLGYTVSTGPTPNPDAMGHVCYRQRRIWLDTVHLWEALVTLCHELGHALAAERMGRGTQSAATPEELEVFATGERRAYLYGWALVVGLGLQEIVRREDWRSFHEDELATWRTA